MAKVGGDCSKSILILDKVSSDHKYVIKGCASKPWTALLRLEGYFASREPFRCLQNVCEDQVRSHIQEEYGIE
jgi:hypothetical protein